MMDSDKLKMVMNDLHHERKHYAIGSGRRDLLDRVANAMSNIWVDLIVLRGAEEPLRAKVHDMEAKVADREAKLVNLQADLDNALRDVKKLRAEARERAGLVDRLRLDIKALEPYAGINAGCVNQAQPNQNVETPAAKPHGIPPVHEAAQRAMDRISVAAMEQCGLTEAILLIREYIAAAENDRVCREMYASINGGRPPVQ